MTLHERLAMSQFNIRTAKSHLSELIQKAILGEEIIIAKNNKPIAKVVPIRTTKHKRRIELAKGSIKIAADFDEPVDDFKDL